MSQSEDIEKIIKEFITLCKKELNDDDYGFSTLDKKQIKVLLQNCLQNFAKKGTI